jgi:PKHD-type hydroxylase
MTWVVKGTASGVAESHVFAMEGFTADEREAINQMFDAIEPIDSVVGTGDGKIVDHDARRSGVRWLYAGQAAWVFQRVEDIVAAVNEQMFGIDLTEIPSVQLTEYSSENRGHYAPHIDNVWGAPRAGSIRKLSIVVQLTDPSEYDGGDLKLYHSHMNPIVAPREVGTVSVFRSHVIHGVTPVTRGVRRSLVAWVHGPAWR